MTCGPPQALDRPEKTEQHVTNSTKKRTRNLRVDPPTREEVEDLDILRVPEAAAFLGVTDTHVYRLVSKGRIPHARVGASIRIRRADLDAMFTTAADDLDPRDNR